MKRRTFNEERDDAIAYLYKEGIYGASLLGRIFKVTRTRIYQILEDSSYTHNGLDSPDGKD